MGQRTNYSVNGINYSVNVKKVKGNEYYVVNFRNAQGKVVEKSTGMKPNRDTLRQAEKRAKEIVSEYAGQHTRKETHAAAVVPQAQPASITNDVLFVDFLADWLKRQKVTVANTTYINYANMVQKHIMPYFNALNLKLTEVKPMHLQSYVSQKLTEISPNTALKQLSLIRTAMQDAFINDLILSNPADKVKKPKKTKPQSSFYNAEELTHLLETAKGTEMEVPIFLAVMFGLRRSEVVGLRWSDIDFIKKTLTVNGSVTRYCDGGTCVDRYDGTLKTDASHSTFKLNNSVCGYFKNLYEHNMNLISNVDDYKEFICVNEIGERLKLDYITHKFSKLLEQNELRHIRFHDLRHSALTLLSKQYSPKVLQGYARHASCSTTTDIYCHSDIDDTLMELDTICTALNFGE